MRGVILVLGLGLLLLGGAGPITAQERPTLGPKNGPTSPPADLGRVKVGDPAPDFTLEALDGRFFTLSDYRGKKNIILVFYRGWW
jgi:peroxiredoxin (alkyl hydroperoxide reductase subunit C)